MTYGHRTGYRADPVRDRIVALPDDLDPLLGIYVAHMGPICANGLLHAAVEEVGADVRALGDGVRGRRVAVVGGGVVGLLTGLFAQAHGAEEVVVVDPTPMRRTAAEGLGLTALDPDAGDVAVALKTRWRRGAGDRGADVVFQCRGRCAALALALRLLRPQGTVIDLAFYTDDGAALPSAPSSTTTGSACARRRSGGCPAAPPTCGTGNGSRPRPSACCGPRRCGAQARDHRCRAVDRGPGAAGRPRRAAAARHPGGAHHRGLTTGSAPRALLEWRPWSRPPAAWSPAVDPVASYWPTSSPEPGCP